jgi:predicted RNA binding protein YcfA (HicA-like mRNA interferase family)
MKLPIISGQKLIKLLDKKGFEIAGRKGSHVRLKKKTSSKTLVTIVPLHKKARCRNTVRHTQTMRNNKRRILGNAVRMPAGALA